MKFWLMIMLLPWASAFNLAWAKQEATITVCSFINSNRVNIRQKPDAGAPVVAVLNRGDGVEAKGRIGDWVEITAKHLDVQGTRSKPLPGYVSNLYINGCSEDDQFDRWRQ